MDTIQILKAIAAEIGIDMISDQLQKLIEHIINGGNLDEILEREGGGGVAQLTEALENSGIDIESLAPDEWEALAQVISELLVRPK